MSQRVNPTRRYLDSYSEKGSIEGKDQWKMDEITIDGYCIP